jgi:hypothetical protein
MKKQTSKKKTEKVVKVTCEPKPSTFVGKITDCYGNTKTYTDTIAFEKAMLPIKFNRMACCDLNTVFDETELYEHRGLVELCDFLSEVGMIITFRSNDKSIHCTNLVNVLEEEFIARFGELYDDTNKTPDEALNETIRLVDKHLIRPHIRKLKKYISKWDCYTTKISNVVSHDYRNKNTENLTKKSWMSLNIDIQFKNEEIRNSFLDFIESMEFNDIIIRHCATIYSNNV